MHGMQNYLTSLQQRADAVRVQSTQVNQNEINESCVFESSLKSKTPSTPIGQQRLCASTCEIVKIMNHMSRLLDPLTCSCIRADCKCKKMLKCQL